jgi:hypothetical protein
MRIRQWLLGIGALLLAGPPAAADSTFCNLNYAPGTAGFGDAVAAGFWLCADAGTSGSAGWGSSVVEVDEASAAPATAAQTGSNGGVFAASASASAEATPGLLRATALAETFAPPPDDGISFARANGAANATFFELGVLEPLGGAAAGTPVPVQLAIDVSGGFAGSGSGDGEVKVFRNGSVVHTRPLFVSTVDSTFVLTEDLPGFAVGDDVGLWMRLTASAGATNEIPNADSAAADMGSTGHLYFEVTSPDAHFVSTSGHDYAAAPEPSAVLLLCAGAGVLAGMRLRRS